MYTRIKNVLPRIIPYHAYSIYSVDIQAGSDITDCIPIDSEQSNLVYNQNHYFGLGPILKPKLADTFG